MGRRDLLIGLVTMIALCCASSGQPAEPQSISLAVTKIEKSAGRKTEYTIRFRITNIGKVTIFCPRKGLGKPNGIDTLDLDMLQADGSWKPLPLHRELPALARVMIGVNEEYDDEFTLEDPFPVSGWQSYPQQPHTIPLRGKLRLTVGYFAGDKEWESYVERKRIKEPSGATKGSGLPQRQAHSEPFTLPSS